MHHFHIQIGGATQQPHGVSLAASIDGSITVAVLGTSADTNQAAALAQGYLDGGRRALGQVAGGVGYILTDRRAEQITVVSAPMCLRQIYWRATGGVLNIASRPEPLTGDASGAHTLRPQALFDYVYFHYLPGPESVYEGVQRLDSGSLLKWDGKRATVERYWHPTFATGAPSSEAEASARLHELIEEAVRTSVAGCERFGAFLSGGLDSSTVAGYAAKVHPGVTTISMGFDTAGYDEMEYARVASRHFNTHALEYYVTPDDVAGTLPDIAAAFAEPFGNSSAAAAFHCARIAREQGIELLLAGDGGDEIFGGNERYAKQMVFERYCQIPAALRSMLLEPIVGVAAHVTRAFPIGKAHSYIEQANVPLPDRLQTYNFLHRHSPAEVFSSAVIEQVDSERPLSLLRSEYAIAAGGHRIDRMLFLDWKFTLHDNDLIKVNTMCDLAGVAVAYPMLDQRLVDFSMNLPADWKVRDGELRWFYRRAMKNFLPTAILEKSKHGFGLPFGAWTRTHEGLKRLAKDSLSSLATRGYFRSEFLDQAVRMHAEGHASYYGELVWILMVLELWLQRHMPNARL